jgi:TP901 family phage tail tape measure protein
MARITYNDAFSGDFNKKVQQLTKDIDSLLVSFKALGKEARDVNKAVKSAKTFQELSKSAKAASDATTKFATAEKKLIKGIQAVRFEATQEAKQLAILNERKRRASKANRDFAKSQLESVRSTNKFGTAIKSFLFKANFLANVMSNLVSTIGRLFVQAIRGAFKVVSEFDGAVANLAAVSGKTREEIKGLTEQAKELGSTTRFTATQIVNLQKELAKLGFTTAEIQASTESIQNFAAATGTELSQSAKIVGVALRVFGLGANEAADAAASLAIATTKSGLAAEQYETILSSVGPVARAYGFTLEDITALTGALVTKGFEANKAATATRNIFLKLADSGGALSKEFGNSVTDFDSLIVAMAGLQEEGVDLNTMLDLTDVRSVAAFAALLEGAESTKELRDSIEDVNEQFEEMVETQLDSIPGDVDLLKSAWQGLLLAFDSDGPIRFVIQFLTNAVLQVSNLRLALKKFHKQSREELQRSFTLLESLTNKQGEHFDEMIEFFDKLTDEELLTRGIDQMAKDFALIRKVNQKEGRALAEEYLRRREETAAREIEIEKDKQARILGDAEAKENRRIAAIEREAAAAERAKEEKRTKAVEKARDELNEAYAESQRLISQIKPPEDITAVQTFDVATGQFSTENIEDELEDFSFFTEELNRQILESNAVWTEDMVENAKSRFKQEDEEAKRSAEFQQNLRVQTLQAIGNFAQAGFDIFTNFRQKEIQDIETKLRINEAKEKISAEKRLAIEKKLDAERAVILTKQAKADKRAALFDIAISTAVAAAQASPVIPLVIAAIAFGALQAAVVASEPLPQFEKGTESAPGGPAVVSEKGRELVREKSGKTWLTPKKKSIVDIPKGASVTPADITDQFLKYSLIANGFEGKADDGMITMIADKLDRLERAIKSKPVSSSDMTPGGILASTHVGNTTLKRLKKYRM